MLRYILAATCAAATSSAATAAVTVIGNSLARSCYEIADGKKIPRAGDFELCDRALSEEGLNQFDTVATYVNRGILHARKGDTKDALADFDRASARDPTEPEAYFNKGALLLRTGAADQALAMFDAAIERRTRFLAGAYFGRAVAQEELGNLKAAYQDYRRASDADPKWADPKLELARFTVRRND